MGPCSTLGLQHWAHAETEIQAVTTNHLEEETNVYQCKEDADWTKREAGFPWSSC